MTNLFFLVLSNKTMSGHGTIIYSSMVRWTFRYHDNLMRLVQTHPEIHASCKRRSSRAKKTEKTFLRQLINLNLERTINANLTGQNGSW